MTDAERIAAVAKLGFTPRQAGFLVTVAMHSGVCLSRHYATFTGLCLGAGCPRLLRHAGEAALRDGLPVRASGREPVPRSEQDRSIARSASQIAVYVGQLQWLVPSNG